MTTETAINTIKEYLEACGKRNLFFQQVILFGSAATGKTHEYSDIDVALVSEQFTGNPITDWHMLSPVGIKFTDIEPHPFSASYFEKGDPFICNRRSS